VQIAYVGHIPIRILLNENLEKVHGKTSLLNLKNMTWTLTSRKFPDDKYCKFMASIKAADIVHANDSLTQDLTIFRKTCHQKDLYLNIYKTT